MLARRRGGGDEIAIFINTANHAAHSMLSFGIPASAAVAQHVEAISSGTAFQKEQAARTLGQLANGNAENKKAIEQTGYRL